MSGYQNTPILDDETLRWLRNDNTPSQIAVSGAAAQQALGLFARNIVGARHAGDLITESLSTEYEQYQ